MLHEEWLLARDCPSPASDPWAARPGVVTPDPLVLAGDGVRCEHPVALMERAATTGWMAANEALLRAGACRSRPLDRPDPRAQAHGGPPPGVSSVRPTDVEGAAVGAGEDPLQAPKVSPRSRSSQRRSA